MSVCSQGDVRTNQNPQLIVLQTLLIREHNRIAYELEALNPHWNDERLFQEARKIVIAEYQHVTYSHWLPLVIGEIFPFDLLSLKYR
jgi:peroxidase